jgi:hypothetical protein
MDENAPMERVQLRLKKMVETIKNDPPNSLGIAHTKYGRPSDELLKWTQRSSGHNDTK